MIIRASISSQIKNY